MGSPHCQFPTHPKTGMTCQQLYMDERVSAHSQIDQDPISCRLRYPHGRDVEKQVESDWGSASRQSTGALNGDAIFGDGDLSRGAAHTMRADRVERKELEPLAE